MYLLGYSLGALVFVSAYRKNESLQIPRRAVFLAPAFALHRRSALLKLVLPYLTRIPSFAPKDMRAHEAGLPAKAYQALFELVDNLHDSWPQGLLQMPSLVIIDPKDELVRYQGIKELVKAKKLGRMKVEPVRLKCKKKQSFHHLISSPKYLSDEEWQNLTGLILDFLSEVEG